MIKKIITLVLVLIGALIMLPYGFGLWNENMGIRGQIDIAVSSQAVSEQPSVDAETVPSDSAVEGDNQTDNGQDTITEESSSPNQAQSQLFPCDISTIFSPDSNTGEGSNAPLPIEPVEASENTDSPESAQVPTEEASAG